MCDFYEARLMDLLALAPDEWQHIENQIDASFVFVLSLGLLYELGKEEIALSTADATEDPAPANHEAVLKSHEGGSLRASWIPIRATCRYSF